MSLQEVMIVNKKGWKTRRENPGDLSLSGGFGALRTQFRVGGGIKGVAGTMAGIAVCGVLAPRMARKWGVGWKGVAVSAVTALAGGLLINRFSRDKTFGTMFTIGGLGMTGWMALTNLFPATKKYSPFRGIGTGTSYDTISGDESLFGLGDVAPFSPEPEMLTEEYVGDRTVTTPFNAAEGGYEGLGADEIEIDADTIVPTVTGL